MASSPGGRRRGQRLMRAGPALRLAYAEDAAGHIERPVAAQPPRGPVAPLRLGIIGSSALPHLTARRESRKNGHTTDRAATQAALGLFPVSLRHGGTLVSHLG